MYGNLDKSRYTLDIISVLNGDLEVRSAYPPHSDDKFATRGGAVNTIVAGWQSEIPGEPTLYLDEGVYYPQASVFSRTNAMENHVLSKSKRNEALCYRTRL